MPTPEDTSAEVWVSGPSSGRMAIVLAREPCVDTWLHSVAVDLKPLPTLFAWPAGGDPVVRRFDGATEAAPSGEDHARVSRLLASQAGAGGRDPEVAGEREFTLQDRAMTGHALDRLLEARNAEPIARLGESLRSRTSVIPFIGAGMSRPFDYPMWGEFLTEAAGSGDAVEVRRLVEAGDFEQAADLVMKSDKDAFYRSIQQRFAAEPEAAKLSSSPLTSLMVVARGPWITTNFDRVLERLFSAAGRPLTSENLVIGRKPPDRVMEALQQDRPALIKIHGDAGLAETLTFTAVEYGLSYGDETRSGPIAQLAWLMYTNRPLLFLGCSLETDRTIRSLEQIRAAVPFLRHYAVVAAHYLVDKLDRRTEKLRQAGIEPLWYPPGDFGRIVQLVDVLVERASIDEIRPPSGERPPARPMGPVAPMMDADHLQWPDITDDHLTAVSEAVAAGRVAFFLGAAVHPRRMWGRDFYRRLAELAEVPPAVRDRADVAQHIADRDGRPRLSELVEEIIRDHYTQPSAVHGFLAELPRRLRESGRPFERLVVLTTNYDAVLERTFDALGEPYHLFLYNQHGDWEGRFTHRAPDGRLTAVRQPDGLRHLGGNDPVIVKLNGGIDPRGELKGSFVVASEDFERLSTRIREVMPAAVWRLLTARSLLFLGHGLREADVRALTKELKAERSVSASWAVQLPKQEPEFWANTRGIHLIEAELGWYLALLTKQVLARLGPPATSVG